MSIQTKEVNGALVYYDDTQINRLTPSFNVRAGDDGAEIAYVQWCRAIQIR